MEREAVLLSYRLGGTDGVSIEARKWEWALHELGFAVRRVAGALCDRRRPDDTVIPGLSIEPTSAPSDGADALRTGLKGADLVVVENLCSLPLNLRASRTAHGVLTRHRGRVLFHHHDLPWQRTELAGVDGFPSTVPGALHVTISHRSRTELETRGIRAHAIHNVFDFDEPPGDRRLTRAHFDFSDGDLVVLQPTRAIARKNVPGGLRFAEALARFVPDQPVRYWLTGPAEDGYDTALARLLQDAAVQHVQGSVERMADAYAAADVVVFPSTWEGFGNPVIESVIARRPLAVHRYPVLDEITACGLRLFAAENAPAVAAWLAAPDDEQLDTNFERARAWFSLDELPTRLEAAFHEHGWTTW